MEMIKCVLCETEFEGFGNNAQPLAEGQCCDDCNLKVIKKRLEIAGAHPSQKKL
jgi:hypothetical protein